MIGDAMHTATAPIITAGGICSCNVGGMNKFGYLGCVSMAREDIRERIMPASNHKKRRGSFACAKRAPNTISTME